MPTSKKMLAKARDIEKKLAALDGPEWASDSSDDEAAAPAKPQAAAQQPKPGKKQQKQIKTESRTIYLGHIPHGFYEKEMEGFFSQFGTVTNLRLSRSKRTGASKGYAFIEFGDAETASIAAKTMDKYLMHGKQLVAHVVPPETASRPKLFKGSDKPFLPRKGGKEQRERCDGPNPASLRKREQKKRQRLAEQFPGYDYPGYTNGETPPAKRGAFQSPPAPASRRRRAAPRRPSGRCSTRRRPLRRRRRRRRSRTAGCSSRRRRRRRARRRPRRRPSRPRRRRRGRRSRRSCSRSGGARAGGEGKAGAAQGRL